MDEAILRAFLAVHGRVPAFDALAVFCAAVLPYALALGFGIACSMLFPRDFSRPLANVKRRWYCILTTGLALLIARGIVASSIRFLYPIARPFMALNFTPLIAHAADDPSFPSGHAVILFALAAALRPFNRRWGMYMYIGAAVNAAARVYTGVHWPSDVVAGAIIGIITVMLVRKYSPQP